MRCRSTCTSPITDVIADIRGLETLARLRTQKRVTFAPVAPSRTPAEQLWREGSLHAALACGFHDTGGMVRVPRDHPAFALVPDDLLLDALVFGGSSAMVAPD
jgi:hypothetical protein